jgi:hypothetical protein
MFASLNWITLPFILLLSKNWVFISYTAAYLPWIFLLVEKLIEKPKLSLALLLAVVKSQFFYQGYVHYVLIVFLMEFFYLLVRAFEAKHLKKLVKVYAISVVFLFFLISPLLFPMLDALRSSSERSGRLAFADFIRNNVSLFDALLSQFFSFRDDVVFGTGSEIYFFGPIFIIVFLLRATSKKKTKPAVQEKDSLILKIMIVSLILSTPLHTVLYFLPLFNQFRWPFKYYLLFLFFLSLLIAKSSEFVAAGSRLRKLTILSLYTATIALNIVVVIAGSTADNMFSSIHLSYPLTVNFSEATEGSSRIFSYKVSNLSNQQLLDSYTFNFATLQKKSHFAGYDPLVSKKISNATLGLNHKAIYKENLDQAGLNYLRIWGVKYIISGNSATHHQELSQFYSLRQVQESNGLSLYEITDTLSLVREASSSNPVPFKQGINELTIYPISGQDEIVVALVPLPNYDVEVDGEIRNELKRTENGMLVLQIPSNTQKVIVQYRDKLYTAGLGVSLVFWSFIAIHFRHDLKKLIWKKREI